MRVIVIGIKSKERQETISNLSDSVDVTFFSSTEDFYTEYQNRTFVTDRIVLHTAGLSTTGTNAGKISRDDLNNSYTNFNDFIMSKTTDKIGIILLTSQTKLAQIFKHLFIADNYIAICEPTISLMRIKEVCTLSISDLNTKYAKTYDYNIVPKTRINIINNQPTEVHNTVNMSETTNLGDLVPVTPHLKNDEGYDTLHTPNLLTNVDNSVDNVDNVDPYDLSANYAYDNNNDYDNELDSTLLDNQTPEYDSLNTNIDFNTNFNTNTNASKELTTENTENGENTENTKTSEFNETDFIDFDVLSDNLDGPIDLPLDDDLKVDDVDVSLQDNYKDATKEVVTVIKEVIKEVKGKNKTLKDILTSLKATKYIIVTGERVVGKTVIASAIQDLISKHVSTLYVDLDLDNHGMVPLYGLEDYMQFSAKQQKGVEILDLKLARNIDEYVIKQDRNKDLLTGEWAGVLAGTRLEELEERAKIFENVQDALGVLKKYQVVIVDIGLADLDELTSILSDAGICIIMKPNAHSLYNTLSSLVKFEARTTVKIQRRLQPNLHYIFNEYNYKNNKEALEYLTVIKNLLEVDNVDWGNVPITALLPSNDFDKHIEPLVKTLFDA